MNQNVNEEKSYLNDYSIDDDNLIRIMLDMYGQHIAENMSAFEDMTNEILDRILSCEKSILSDKELGLNIIRNIMSDVKVTNKKFDIVEYKQVDIADTKSFLILSNYKDCYNLAYFMAEKFYDVGIRDNLSLDVIVNCVDKRYFRKYYYDIAKNQAEYMDSVAGEFSISRLTDYCIENNLISKSEVDTIDKCKSLKHELIYLYIDDNTPDTDEDCMYRYMHEVGTEDFIKEAFDRHFVLYDFLNESSITDKYYSYVICGFTKDLKGCEVIIDDNTYYIYDISNSPIRNLD